MSGDKSYLKPIGQRLMELRSQLGFRNREQFAEAFGAPKKTFEKYEQGLSELPTRLMLWLSDEHHVNLDWLVTGEGQMFDEPSKASPSSAGVDIVLLQQLHDTVQAVFVECKQTPPPRAVTAEAGELYNQLLGMVSDIRDKAVVTALIPVLRQRFKERIASARPGTGKREAS